MSELTDTGRVAPETIRAWERHLGREVEADSLRANLVEGTLPQEFHDAATRYPERTALTIDGQKISHGELDRLAARAGGWLQAQGIGSGDRVVLCGDNSLNFVIAYLGILRVGGIVVPAGAALTEPELRHFMEDSAAACALAQGDGFERLMKIAREDSPLRLVMALKGEEASEAPSLQQTISVGESLEPGDASGDDVVMLAYTSGTTGRPKGVPLSHANLLSSVRSVMWAWRWDASDVLVHALPFSHQHGLSAVHISLLCGSRAVVHSKFDPERLCKAIEAEKATVLFAVPAIYEKLIAWEGIEEADF
ncbi:MAG TPA: long-chain fatty acid--CoA ligase, partial [Rubrobacteraceae bacterium]|nr:long-chain fatty acid--CoA ligase [Rubrobacteraceae bacterium]